MEKIEQLNTHRRKLQEESFKEAEKIINDEENILIAYSTEFHE
jgi:single-stranded DNA-specific DHH superfamily exonuclease